jgi:Zn finger protein HypA/HybF involved in hydrogenase expression
MINETGKASFAGWSFCIGLAAGLLWAPFAGAQVSPHGKLTVPCEQCHGAESWSTLANPLKFSHASTGFSLDGQHALVRCTGCHSTLKFADAKTRCADCHDDVHRGELGKLCDRCHTPRSWLVPDMTQRHKGTRFALVGAHVNAECRACHRNQQKNQYSGVQTECYACHAADYNGAKNPDHRSGGISTDCSQCHSVAALRWGGDFNHASTGFPLTGAHLSLP